MTISFWSLSAVASLASLAHIWLRRPRSRWRRNLAWSVAVWVPLLGPLFYFGMYTLPGKHDELSKAEANDHTGGWLLK